jgi:hypothetical protein
MQPRLGAPVQRFWDILYKKFKYRQILLLSIKLYTTTPSSINKSLAASQSIFIIGQLHFTPLLASYGWKIGTPTKRQVSKLQVSKRPVSKRLKRQVYKTSGLQNVRFTKHQVYKTSGLQNVRLKKKTSIYILYLWLVEIRRFCCSRVCRQSDGCVLFSILEVFFATSHHNR